ncbi:hypothetical protein D3C71_1626180 [compost metagenome]
MRGHAQQLVAGVDERLVSGAAAVLQAEGKPAGIAQFRNGWWAQRKDEGIANARKTTEGAVGQVLGGLTGAVAILPVLEGHERQCSILSLAGEAEAQHTHHALHFSLFEDELFDLLHHGQRAFLRCAGRQLHVDDDVALVLTGQERRGQAHIHDHHGTDDGGIDDEVARGAFEHA